MSRLRYLLMSMPPPVVCRQIDVLLQQLHLAPALRTLLVKPANLHQSLSDRYWPDELPDVEQRLRRALAQLQAHKVTMTLNWISGHEGYASLKPRGMPTGFQALLDTIRLALEAQGLKASASNTPHITLSYLTSLSPDAIEIAPIEWTIDRILLVKSDGDGEKYRYEELQSQQLLDAPLESQQGLF